MLRVFVISPLPAVRAGLRAMIGAGGDAIVSGEADHFDESAPAFGGAGPTLDPQFAAELPDVVVIDGLPPLDAGEADEGHLPYGGGNAPGIVVLGPVPDDERLPAILAGRAWAYLPREAGEEQLLAGIRAVAGGLVTLDRRLAAHLLDGAGQNAAAAPLVDGGDLTAREREVLQLVAQGLANKMIARQLGISEHTVKFHVAAVLAKLGAGSRTEAVHLAARRGLVAL
ncbi:MAG: response regulator transcription factor [Chloroflexi bacterium]|nr:response regulator transcription factor [Chloroflexota bacterium]